MQRGALTAGLVAILSLAASAQGWQLPAHFQAVPVPGSFAVPVGLVFTPDGSLFVVEKPGKVKLLDPGGVQQPQLFIDLTAEVNNDWDRGLLSLALHPGWVPDGGPTSWVYLLYTVSPVPPLDNGYNTDDKYSFSRLTRYRATTSNGSVVADLASREVLLGHQEADGSVPDCIASVDHSHSNGRMIFSPDGTLLIATGEGAHSDFTDTGGFDPPGFDDWTHPVTGLKGPTPALQDGGAFRAQDLRSLAGKVLRVDADTGHGLPSNPFWDGDPASNASRIWALGLRNPFRMALVPGTGAKIPYLGRPGVLVIGDVGWNEWEELDVSRTGGENFGWPCHEGFPQQADYQAFHATDQLKLDCHGAPVGVLTDPSLAWNHGAANLLAPAGLYQDENGTPLAGFTGACSIGGAVYTGGSYPSKYVGRCFFSDYVSGAIRTIEFDGGFHPTAVRDFASGTGSIVDIETSPLTGELYLCDIGNFAIWHITYGTNLAPTAVLSASVTHGPAPLTVELTGSASSDPDPGDTLSFDWDFGDGSPHATSADTSHTFVTDGLYDVRLVVTDGLLLTSEATVQVAAGNAPPMPAILAPTMAQTFQVPTVLQLSGAATDPDGDDTQLAWTIDLYHSTHVHPAVATFAGPQASFEIPTSPEDDELLYYRVTLTATDPGGLSASTHVFVYPSARLVDVAGTAQPIARMDELVPPQPTGTGNHDVEVVRDGVFPPVGSADDSQQYDTFHGGAQGGDDWIGYELAAPPTPEFRFTGFTFQEGRHFADGGWWKDLRVEVRSGGTWSVASNLHVTPAYPFALSGQPFFDGVSFQTYSVEFDPQAGDAVRLRGTPGGSAHYISVGELRCRGLAAAKPSAWRDITAEATEILSKVDGLVPPGPLGAGSKDKETIRNGTFPPLGSASVFAQYDTFHNGDQAGDDWIGYDFGVPRTIGRLLYQAGVNAADGGAFVALNVQVQAAANGPWTTVPGVICLPPYTGLDATSYQSFDLQFPQMIARAVRLQGAPAGSKAYASVGELRVFEPTSLADCGWQQFGVGLPGSNTLNLVGMTPPVLGQLTGIRAFGAAGANSGMLMLSFTPANLAVAGGTLLVEPSTMFYFPIAFTGGGTFTLAALLPADPGLQGLAAYLQVAAFHQPHPWSIRFSNALQMTFCGP